MKIAFLSFYNGAIDRGVEVATTELIKRLSRKHDVTLFQAGNRMTAGVQTVEVSLPVDWKVPDASGTTARKIYADYWSRKITAFTWKFLPYFLKNKYDVVIPTNGGWQVVLCRFLTWISGKKMIVQGNAGTGYDDFFQLHCFPNRYVAISPNGFAWAKRFAPWIQKTYIPYGVDVQAVHDTKPGKIPLKKPIVLCVGAFSPYKQIDLLIKAMAQVKDASLVVIGLGVQEKHLRELGEKLLGKRFLLLTGITHDQLFGFYKAASIFSLPSAANEAFGIVYVEALAAGLPVVAPDDRNRREIIGEAGEFVDVTDTTAYAKALELAIAKDFGEAPRRQALQFDWDTIAAQYESLLKGLFT